MGDREQGGTQVTPGNASSSAPWLHMPDSLYFLILPLSLADSGGGGSLTSLSPPWGQPPWPEPLDGLLSLWPSSFPLRSLFSHSQRFYSLRAGHPSAGASLWHLMPPFFSALGSLWRKTPPPPLAPVPWVGIPVASVVYKLPSTGTGSLLLSFGGLPAEWQIWPPQGSAFVTPVSSLDRVFALPLSALGLQHV